MRPVSRASEGAAFRRVSCVLTAEGHPCLSVSAGLKKFLKCEICLRERPVLKCFLEKELNAPWGGGCLSERGCGSV